MCLFSLRCSDSAGSSGVSGEVEPNDEFYLATSVGVLETDESAVFDCILGDGDMDWFSFEVPQGLDGLVRATVTSQKPVDPDLVVLMGDGEFRAFGWTWNDTVEEVLFGVSGGQRYYLRVSAEAGQGSEYGISFIQEEGAPVPGKVAPVTEAEEPNDSPMGCQMLPDGASWEISGELGGDGGSLDFFCVPVKQGTLEVSIQWEGGVDVDSVLLRKYAEDPWGNDMAGYARGVSNGQETYWASVSDLPEVLALSVFIYDAIAPEFEYTLRVRYLE
jgi:hypothetical protein